MSRTNLLLVTGVKGGTIIGSKKNELVSEVEE
jgi:hypothetical protein